jgi:hypothetical protein
MSLLLYIINKKEIQEKLENFTAKQKKPGKAEE